MSHLPESAQQGEQSNLMITVKWAIPILLGVLTYVLCAPLGESIRLYLAFTIWGVFAWVFEILPESLVGMMMVVFYILAGVAKPAQVFAPWSTQVPWLVFGGMILSLAMQQSGLAKRIAYKIISLTGTSYVGILLSLAVIGIVLTPLVTTPSPRILLLAPIMIGIFQVLDIKQGSQAGMAFMLAVLFAVWSPSFLFLTSDQGVLAADAVFKTTGQTIDFVTYMIYMSPVAVMWAFLSVLTLIVVRPGKIALNKETLQKNYRELGAMTRTEKWSAALFTIMLALFLADTYHKVSPAWIIILVGSVMFFPGINVLKKADMSKINFTIIVFITTAIAIGEAANACGATKLFAKAIIPYLQGQSGTFVVMATWFIGVVGQLLLNPLAIMGSFFVPIVEVFHILGINPHLGPYALMLGFNNLIFPFELAPALIAYSFGYIKLMDMVKIGVIRIVVGFVFMIAAVIPYWKLMGLM